MLSRTQIRQFLAVVDRGSFTKAASSLYIAQPSLSAGIAELERQLGNKLFIRERRRIRLTAAGNTLLPLARAIEEDFHQVETQVSRVPVSIRPIRLGVQETIATAMLEHAMSHYRGAAPLELMEGSDRELRTALSNGTIDLALAILSTSDSARHDEILLVEDYVLAMPETHMLAKAGTISTKDVAGEIMIARRSCEILTETSRFFTESGVRPSFSLRSHNDDRVMAMVRAGLGVTVAPRSLCGSGIAAANIRHFNQSRRVGLRFATNWIDLYGMDHDLVIALRRVGHAI